MENLGLTLLIGTLTGLATAAIVLLVKQFTTKVILPWHENVVYQDARIEGKWYGRARIAGHDVERSWEIRRQGHRITATITSTVGPDQGEVFQMTGSFKNLILTGTYSHSNAANTARGTYTLRLVGDGDRLEGFIAYFETDKAAVQPGVYVLTRTKDQAGSPLLKSSVGSVNEDAKKGPLAIAS